MATDTTARSGVGERTVDERWAGWVARRAKDDRWMRRAVAAVTALISVGLLAWFQIMQN
jgi:hypothetical protein